MELPDHVAVELEFLYLLIFNRNQASQTGKLGEAAKTEVLLQRFLGEHLGIWVVPFSAAVAARSQTAFYRELAVFTARFVRMQSVSSTVH